MVGAYSDWRVFEHWLLIENFKKKITIFFALFLPFKHSTSTSKKILQMYSSITYSYCNIVQIRLSINEWLQLVIYVIYSL